LISGECVNGIIVAGPRVERHRGLTGSTASQIEPETEEIHASNLYPYPQTVTR